jgi:hypothetical protein
MKRTAILWLPGALLIVVLPVALALTGQETHPWRLTWMIPLALAGTWVVIAALSRLSP